MRTVRRWLTGPRPAQQAGTRQALRSYRPGELRRLWGAFRRLRSAVFDEGGATVDSPADRSGSDGRLHARTVIQGDGDVLCFVHEAAVADAAVLRAHSQAVAAWYREANTTVTALGVRLRTLHLTLSSVVGVASGVGAAERWTWWGLAAALAVFVVALPVGQAVIGRLLRRGMVAALS